MASRQTAGRSDGSASAMRWQPVLPVRLTPNAELVAPCCRRMAAVDCP
jgi:hypothetical protein